MAQLTKKNSYNRSIGCNDCNKTYKGWYYELRFNKLLIILCEECRINLQTEIK